MVDTCVVIFVYSGGHYSESEEESDKHKRCRYTAERESGHEVYKLYPPVLERWSVADMEKWLHEKNPVDVKVFGKLPDDDFKRLVQKFQEKGGP